MDTNSHIMFLISVNEWDAFIPLLLSGFDNHKFRLFFGNLITSKNQLFKSIYRRGTVMNFRKLSYEFGSNKNLI